MPGLKKEKQDGRQDDAERRCEDCRGLRGQWMFEGVSEQLETEERKSAAKKLAKLPKARASPPRMTRGLTAWCAATRTRVSARMGQPLREPSRTETGSSTRRNSRYVRLGGAYFFFRGAPQTQRGLGPSISLSD